MKLMEQPSRSDGVSGLSPSTREKLSQVGTANIANSLLRRGFRNAYLLGLHPVSGMQESMVGPAYTLRFMPALNVTRAEIAEMIDCLDGILTKAGAARRVA